MYFTKLFHTKLSRDANPKPRSAFHRSRNTQPVTACRSKTASMSHVQPLGSAKPFEINILMTLNFGISLAPNERTSFEVFHRLEQYRKNL